MRSVTLSEKDEERLVAVLANLLGFGRVMQLSELLWRRYLKRSGLTEGGAHSVGPCVHFLVPCEHEGSDGVVGCQWCCGSGRVTERVLRAMREVRR